MNKKFVVSLMTSLVLAGPLLRLTVVDASQNSEDAVSQEDKSFEKEKAELEETISDAQATIDDLVIDISSQEEDIESVKTEIEQTQKEIAQLEEQMKLRNEKLMTKASSNKNEVKNSTNPFERMKDENNSASSDQYIKLAQLGDQKMLDKAEEQAKRQEEELKSAEAELKVNRDDIVSQRTELEDRIVKVAEKFDMSDDEKESFVNEQTIIAERTSSLNEELKNEQQRILEEEREKEEAERLAEEKRKKEKEAEEKAKAEAEKKAEKEKAAKEKAKVEVKAEVSTSSSEAAKEPKSSGWTRPASGNMTSPFGYRTHPVTGERDSFHAGIDIAGSGSVVASRAGTVTQASYSDTYGYTVIVDHGDGYSTLYAHLKKGLSVSNGQSVSQGQQVGIMGTTGRSTGVHLHFEVRKGGEAVNPMNYLN
ncbi:Murein DD-endopeptidase MepM and murein hydrolase activator NlpD, contain LysM domain [Alkalibacterium subtropicum]|uniref:Murein DD-endopeptidase MepM and murein hydrolase activator NlpD, contain LysM domain n=1 Tax=Alkalibacterium subtropicum TaxID=753702 RepID=A0A1I1FXI7_9LACT|nr:M23 family metallopeptidase [Alkalibacterium subtropicum]SFC04054.1 Murein DD-endopeptidase MepM and murein hydrolase activator NlpD, contain LysM domain [Alkalibacterium subtropicum]